MADPFNKEDKLHPLLSAVAELIRKHIINFSDLALLNLDPEFIDIYSNADGIKLSISNELHQAKGFRKLHLEIAKLGRSLQILHCVFFPDPRFNLPIFGVDLVASNGQVTAAILDLSPVSNSLPQSIQNDIEKIGKYQFERERELPEWGQIFSSNFYFVQPVDTKEENLFLKLVDQYLCILISYSNDVSPDDRESITTIQRYERQKLYCLQQKRNDKTRKVLAKTFNEKWAENYIDIVLFDYPENP